MSTRLMSSAPRTDAAHQSSLMGEPAAARSSEIQPGEAPDARQDPQAAQDIVIRVRDLVVGFGDKTVLDHLDLDVYRGEVLGVIGASGSGKSVLTRAIIGLIPKRQGTIEIFGENVDTLSVEARRAMERRWGIMFQHGALFSSLTVKQNVQVPMREYLDLSDELLEELASLKIAMAGLPADAADKYPSELSGGMTKRAALARALALDPEVLFLDEPTSGLDPIGAGEFDELIKTLQDTLKLTVFMITHDLDSLHAVCDRVAALARGKVIAAGTIAAMLTTEDPWLRAYFQGPRARAAIARPAADDPSTAG
ncbi:Phospholipid/cholesterol/gamma-HCH transport system ATP-binding protein [Chelatococcus asaccharovorans]|nr:Phospholipid/cholesterol/gamma-HCH transport system ATP-binding protein [Chelatococcus asaccharovorans]CAH1684013.1 Phospholipid/cholesterol/gamma-HCH transport system ATP-binding protein [Chelatococcus asaccharovorans]